MGSGLPRKLASTVGWRSSAALFVEADTLALLLRRRSPSGASASRELDALVAAGVAGDAGGGAEAGEGDAVSGGVGTGAVTEVVAGVVAGGGDANGAAFFFGGSAGAVAEADGRRSATGGGLKGG